MFCFVSSPGEYIGVKELVVVKNLKDPNTGVS